jgi:hypothetical protein
MKCMRTNPSAGAREESAAGVTCVDVMTFSAAQIELADTF